MVRETAANVEMQGIEFQIINDSSEASKSVDTLSQSLTTLGKSTADAGNSLDKVAESINKLRETLSKINTGNFKSQMKRIAKGLLPLSKISFNSITSFAKELNALSVEKLAQISQLDFSNLERAADSARTISNAPGGSGVLKAAESNSLPLTDMGTTEIPAKTAEMSKKFEEVTQRALELQDTINNTNSVDAFINAASDADILKMKLDEVKAKLAELIATDGEKAPGVANLIEKAKKLQEQLDGVSKSAKKASDSSKTLVGHLKSLAKSISRIAMYRAIRSFLSGITNSLKEGIQNLTKYSAAMNELDSSHANKTMTEFSSKWTQVKNSIAAAAMPILNALLPAFRRIADAIIKATNAVNQFFAALNGQNTFTQAIYNAEDYAGSLEETTGAATKLKRTLAGFDELNILEDSSSGGGGSSSGSNTNYEDMFQETEINRKIKKLVEWLRENMDAIETTVLTIGGALLTWKVTNSLLSGVETIVQHFQTGRKELNNWQTALQKISGSILIAAGVTLSYDASYDIGYGTASVMSYIEEVLGVIASTVGGYLVFDAAGAVFGFVLSILVSVKGYFEGEFDAEAVENFSKALSTGGVSFTEYAQAATTAMKEVDGVNGIIAGYAQSLTEQDEKINSSKLALERYITKWNETGTVSKEEIQGIVDELDNLVTASQEKLSLAAQILETTLVEAIKNAGAEAGNTYRELLGMIYLLESQGNRTVAGWKTELALAEEKLANLDETSETYEEDAAALMETIEDLVFKIAGIGGTSNNVTKDLKDLGTTVGNLDFSDMLENPEVAMQALEALTAATEAAYENARSVYQGDLDAIDGLFSYVDTRSAEWAAVYQRALNLGLDPETAFDDVDAVKELFAGYFKDIYQSNVKEIDSLATEAYGTISESLANAMEEAMAESKQFAVDEFGNLWSWDDAFNPNTVALSQEGFEEYKKEFIKIFRTDEVIDGLIDAFDDSFSRIKSSATMAVAAASFSEPFETGVRDWSESVNMDDVASRVVEKFGASFEKYEMPYFEATDPIGTILDRVSDISWDDVGEKISKGWDTVKDWAGNAISDVGDWISDTWEGIMPSIGTKIFRAADTSTVETAQRIIDAAKTTAENQNYGSISGAIKQGIDASVKQEDFVGTGSSLVSDISEGITLQTSNKPTGFLSSALSNVANVAEGLVTDLFGIGTKTALFRSKGEEMIEDMAEGLTSGASMLEGFVEDINHTIFSTSDAYSSGYSFGTSLGEGISKALKNYSYPTLKGNITTSDDGTTSIRFKAYAEGGFVDAGQLFIAREAGAEMVGTIGGHTAVANNDQIENAISNAVYRAMVSAMSRSNGGNSRGGTQVVTAKVNEKTLFEVVLDYARRETVRTGKNCLVEI